MQRVILADDDAAFRAQLEEIVTARLPGAEIVASVGDSHEAVAAAMLHSPAVVLIDYAMPGPSGSHTAAVIRQALPGARVVILSGIPQPEMEDLVDGIEVVAKGAGMDDALVDVLARQ